ncbi:hypothetical protein PR048_024269 [Dryococelus australis]|uniref:Uncharacterized protein n=1 Tax=Dryococelus australis TaxID=614101 RepID=A0ABQ9GN45_9NEOP|nr:hypothetical protein PR048_024269 [Dryococelus australis]
MKPIRWQMIGSEPRLMKPIRWQMIGSEPRLMKPIRWQMIGSEPRLMKPIRWQMIGSEPRLMKPIRWQMIGSEPRLMKPIRWQMIGSEPRLMKPIRWQMIGSEPRLMKPIRWQMIGSEPRLMKPIRWQMIGSEPRLMTCDEQRLASLNTDSEHVTSIESRAQDELILDALLEKQKGAAVAQWSECRPPAKTGRVRFPVESPSFACVENVLAVAVGRRVFSGDSHIPRPRIQPLFLHQLSSRSLALKTFFVEHRHVSRSKINTTQNCRHL